MAESKYLPLTVENISRELHGVECMNLGKAGLGAALSVPFNKLDEIKQQHSLKPNQMRATVEHWLSLDPTPSWRRLVWALDVCKEHHVVDRVKPYMEPLTDPSLTAENVSSVLETVEETTMGFLLNVPNSRRFFFGGRDSIEPERRQACVDWWLQCSPNASWTWLAGQLYLEEQKTALETVQLQYIQKETADSTLTPTNLLTALTAVTYWKRAWGLHHWLQIPQPTWYENQQELSCDDGTQVRKMVLERWLQNHPAPSWAVVAEALYQMKEHDRLEQVKKTYFTGSLSSFLPSHHLAPAELEKHHSSTSSILHFPRGTRNDIFHSLIAFLISNSNIFPRAWKLAVQVHSTVPVCLSRNCVVFTVPGFPGRVTLIDSHRFYEVHISADIEQPKLCLYVRDAMITGVEKAAANLHYTNCHPEIAFPCPCSQGELHPATVSDDKTLWLCSIDNCKFGKLEEKQLMWICSTEKGGVWSAGYNKLQRKRDKIIRNLADQEFTRELAEKLHGAEMITREIYDQAKNVAPGVVEVDRATVLFNAVLASVELNPAKYDKFISILRQIRGSDDLVTFIEAA